MPATPSFDLDVAHRFFSADCFNRAWDLIEATERSPEDDLKMLALSQASIFHWLNRPDVSERNLSVGYWQASRVLALVGQPSGAKWLAEVSLNYAGKLGPFLRAYAYEGLARAAIGLGELDQARHWLAEARSLTAQVTDAEDRALLEGDLTNLTERIEAEHG